MHRDSDNVHRDSEIKDLTEKSKSDLLGLIKLKKESLFKY